MTLAEVRISRLVVVPPNAMAVPSSPITVPAFVTVPPASEMPTPAETLVPMITPSL